MYNSIGIIYIILNCQNIVLFLMWFMLLNIFNVFTVIIFYFIIKRTKDQLACAKIYVSTYDIIIFFLPHYILI